MPFQSEKQRRYLHANHPEIANRWEAKYGLGGIAELNSQLNSLPEYYLPKNQGGLIPSHQAGIYGLAEGGVPDIGFSKVKPSNDGSRPGYFTAEYGGEGAGRGEDAPSSSGSGGGEGYQNVHQTGAVSETPGRTTTTPDPDRGWQTYAIEDKKKTTTTDDRDDTRHQKDSSGFLSDVRRKNKEKYIDLLKKYHTSDFDVMSRKSKPTTLSEEKQKFLEPYGMNIWKDMSLVDPAKFFDIREGISPKLDPTKVVSPRQYEWAKADYDFSDIEGYTADINMPMSGLVNYEQFKENITNWPELGLKEQFEKEGLTTPKQQEQFFDVFEKALREKSRGLKKQTPTISTEEIQEAMDAGYIMRSAEGGIAGLKQGGRIGFFTGMREAEQEAQSTGGEYQNVHQTGAVSQTPGRTTTPDLPPQLGGSSTGEDAITYARDNFETQKATLESKINKSIGWKILGGILGGGLTLGLGDLRTAKNMYDLVQVKKDYINLLENAKTLYQKQGGPEFNPHVDTAIQTINQEILDLTQTRDTPDQVPDGAGGVTGVASITYDEEDQEALAYKASADANKMLEDVRNPKRDAYLAAFRQKYLMGDTEEPQTMFVAQGGRIPGYNTGGLSNLFRLKNV